MTPLVDLFGDGISMEFRLSYRGELLRSQHGQRGKRTREKHALRLEFHRQLADLWKRDPRLSSIDPEQLKDVVTHSEVFRGRFDVQRNAEKHIPLYEDTPLRGFLYQRPFRGYRFIPLVTGVMHADCRLEITISRSLRRGTILYAGDLDGRLKVLLDALSMPLQKSDLPCGVTGGDEICFCLLEEDVMVTDLCIESKQLLGEDPAGHVAEVEIDVIVRPVIQMLGTRDIHRA